MKNICPLILSPITLILNQSLSTGIFPDRLKIANIIPWYKKEDPHKLDNFRPISLLPAFSNIFEKAAFIQLYEYFVKKNNLWYKSQYGFRTFHSTELAPLEIIDIIGKDLDNRKLPIGKFLDLSKAFDMLDHTILLDKLLYYGIKGTELAWLKLPNKPNLACKLWWHKLTHFIYNRGCASRINFRPITIHDLYEWFHN